MNITDVESDFIATGLRGIAVSWAHNACKNIMYI